ncbi:hypothetical protein V5740_10460 [Croceibacterium sp. TMG7-5b_MA50]|uniref:hypothetical protein n=1 Tax=Croceibacterium sp. TMG7-5b_MA50 TaxID=3121290 RepID=UPI0032218628
MTSRRDILIALRNAAALMAIPAGAVTLLLPHDGATARTDGMALATFDALPATNIPRGTDRVRTGAFGNGRRGTGGATYVSDALATAALARAHPDACRASANGRLFRLLPAPSGAITPEQLGCPAIGNAQPAFAATLAYAHAAGIERVELPAQRYDLWAPPRRRGEHANTGLSGHYLLVRENLAIVGTARGRTLLRCLNSRGGSNDTVTQPNMTYAAPQPTGDMLTQQRNWMGSGVNVRPNTSMDFLRLENVEIDGTRTFDPAAPREPQINLTHKGVRVQDVNCARIELANVALRNWGGEIYYTAGGTGVREELLENCVFDGSPQCTINSGTAARSTYTDVVTGNSYQAEIIGGRGKTVRRCRFHDLRGVSLMGGAGAGPDGPLGNGYPFSYPIRRAGQPAPWMTFEDVTMERCGTVAITSFARGALRLIDSQLGLGTAAGRLTDIDLDVTAVMDRTRITEPLSLSGPDNLQTPVGRTRTMVAPPDNIRVDLTCQRTAAARAAGRSWQQAVRVYPKLFDARSITITVHGNGAARLLTVTGTPVRGHAMPRIVAAPDFTPAA